MNGEGKDFDGMGMFLTKLPCERKLIIPAKVPQLL
jgi:hypothetical protein